MLLGALAYDDPMLPADHAARHSLVSVYAALMERPRTVFLVSGHLLGMSITRTAPGMTWTLRHLPLPILTIQLLLMLPSRPAAPGLLQGQVLPPGLQVTRLTFLCTLTPTLT